MTTATIYDYEGEDSDVRDISPEQARQFVSEHASGIEKVERSTAWTSTTSIWPEQFKVVVRIAFPLHALVVSFEGHGINVVRGRKWVGGRPVDNWPLEYGVASDEADAFYQAALAEQEAART